MGSPSSQLNDHSRNLRLTVAPASRQTRAKVISVGTFRRFNLPDREHAALCPTCHSGHGTRTSHLSPKFEDLFPVATEWQEHGAREAAWRPAKSILKLKEKKQSSILLTFAK